MIRLLHLPIIAVLSLIAAPIPQSLPRLPEMIVPVVPASDRSLQGEALAKANPIAYLQDCQDRSRAAIRGYRAQLIKRERIGGQLYPREVIDLAVCESPFKILLLWREGERKVLGSAVMGTLFVGGENQGKMKVWRPKAFIPIIDAGTTDSAARNSARYALPEGGLFHALERTLTRWSLAQQKGRLTVNYLGRRAWPELNGIECDIFERICDPLELDSFVLSERAPTVQDQPTQAIHKLTIMIEPKSGLQVGAKLEGVDGALIGEYYFQIEELNPNFNASTFTIKSFSPGKKQ